jgi:hypothetical protein
MTDTSILIHAPAQVVYDLVADPMRMAEWSPECVRCRWISGATRTAVGARFRGTSRNGRWTTTSTIAEMRAAGGPREERSEGPGRRRPLAMCGPPGYGSGPVYRKMNRPKSRSLARTMRSPFWSSARATPQKLLPLGSM